MITFLISQTYGVKYSTSQVSIITNTLMEDIEQWQSRPLQDQYAMVWIDGIHYKIRHLCSDNLTGLDKAVEAVFPKSIRQVCIVHQIRNSLRSVTKRKVKQSIPTF